MAYRCYLIKRGRIVLGEDVPGATLDDAVVAGKKMLADQPNTDQFNGFEIWQACSLLYTCEAKA